MKQKRARTVDLISVHDYPADRYTAYWTIGVDGDDELGYRWWAEIHSYQPHSWKHEGKTTTERPDMPEPLLPEDVGVSQKRYETMSPVEQAAVRQQQDDRRAEISRITAAHPQAVHLLVEQRGVEDTRDAADTAAQKWVLGAMKKYRRKDAPTGKQAGFMTLGLILSPLDLLTELLARLARLFGPMFALGYSTTIRNERLQRVQVNLDLGAGAAFFRIYDSTRPATCGTATTLLAELTFTDPVAPSASGGVLTMSAITADASANATGTATWFRCVDSTGTCCVDGNVGTSGSDLNLNSTSIATGQNVAVTSFVITEGNP